MSYCTNTIMVTRQVVESLLLKSIKADLFRDEGYAVVKEEVARVLAERRRARTPDVAKLQARLAEVKQEIHHIMAAIKAGILTPTTKTELENAEAERAQLLQQTKRRPKADTVTTFLPNTMGRFQKMVEGLAEVTQRQVDVSRSVLRMLLGGTDIALHPTADGVTRYLTAEVTGDYGGLIRLMTNQNKSGGGEGS